jgi:hypothetical protein
MGTMLGLIQIFSRMKADGLLANVESLSGGVWQALICSAAGLAVAIPAHAGYNYLVSRVNAIVLDMERAATEIVNIVTDQGGLRDTSMVHLYPEADLEPAPLTSNTIALHNDTPTAFQFHLRNHGRMPASMTHWQVVLDDGTTLAAGDTSVAGLDSVTVQTVLAPAGSPGLHSFRVVADTLRTLTETVESNNAMELKPTSRPERPTSAEAALAPRARFRSPPRAGRRDLLSRRALARARDRRTSRAVRSGAAPTTKRRSAPHGRGGSPWSAKHPAAAPHSAGAPHFAVAAPRRSPAPG